MIHELEAILNDIPELVEKEYRFSKRRFKFDYAIHVNGKIIGIEYEGDVWTSGRHTRPKGYINDCTKYNLACELGYPVLRYTVDHLKEPKKVKDQILMVIERVKNEN